MSFFFLKKKINLKIIWEFLVFKISFFVIVSKVRICLQLVRVTQRTRDKHVRSQKKITANLFILSKTEQKKTML